MHFKKSFGIKRIRRTIKSEVKDKREDKQTRKEEEGGRINGVGALNLSIKEYCRNGLTTTKNYPLVCKWVLLLVRDPCFMYAGLLVCSMETICLVVAWHVGRVRLSLSLGRCVAWRSARTNAAQDGSECQLRRSSAARY